MSTERIKTALNHVREHYPNVCMVVFNKEARWQYMDEDFNAPAFTDEIDVSILEDALYDVQELPFVYEL